ncbi:hypothetical protein HKX48_001952, partial [Thoreauomyces humboldtii]
MEKLLEGMEKVSGKISEVENQLRSEMLAKVEKEMSDRQAAMDAAMERERQKREQEITAAQEAARREFERERATMAEDMEALKAKLLEEQKKTVVVPPVSKFGTLEDDDDGDDSFGVSSESSGAVHRELADIKNSMASSKKETQADIEARLKAEKQLQDERERKAALEMQTWRAQDAKEIADLKDALDRLKGQITVPPPVQAAPVKPTIVEEDVDSDLEIVEAPGPPPPPAPTVSGHRELDWETALKLMNNHLQTPLPTSSHVKTLFPHDPARFEAQRIAIAQSVDLRLTHLGVQPDAILDGWGLDEGVEEDCEQLAEDIRLEMEQKAKEDPLHGKMKSFLEETVDRVAGGFRSKRFQKPPPIVTMRPGEGEGVEEGEGIRAVIPHADDARQRRMVTSRDRAASQEGRARGVTRDRSSYFQRRASSVPADAPAPARTTGWRSHIWNRADKDRDQPSAEVDWSNNDSSTEYSGSDEEVVDEVGPKRDHSKPYRRSRREGEEAPPRSASSARSRSAGPLRRTTRASPTRVTVPPSPNKIKAGFERLTRALSFSTAGATKLWNRTAAPPSFPKTGGMTFRRGSRGGESPTSPRRSEHGKDEKGSSKRRGSAAAGDGHRRRGKSRSSRTGDEEEDEEEEEEEEEDVFFSDGSAASSDRSGSSAASLSPERIPARSSVKHKRPSSPRKPSSTSRSKSRGPPSNRLALPKHKQRNQPVADTASDASSLSPSESVASESVSESVTNNSTGIPRSYSNRRTLNVIDEESSQKSAQPRSGPSQRPTLTIIQPKPSDPIVHRRPQPSTPSTLFPQSAAPLNAVPRKPAPVPGRRPRALSNVTGKPAPPAPAPAPASTLEESDLSGSSLDTSDFERKPPVKKPVVSIGRSPLRQTTTTAPKPATKPDTAKAKADEDEYAGIFSEEDSEVDTEPKPLAAKKNAASSALTLGKPSRPSDTDTYSKLSDAEPPALQKAASKHVGFPGHSDVTSDDNSWD